MQLVLHWRLSIDMCLYLAYYYYLGLRRFAYHLSSVVF